jgi:hypothetical protein
VQPEKGAAVSFCDYLMIACCCWIQTVPIVTGLATETTPDTLSQANQPEKKIESGAVRGLFFA